MNRKNDLTEGSISKNLVKYFIPIEAGTLFQQLYNAVDAVIVGKYVGTAALAAVGGSASVLTNIIISFFVALSGGAAVVIAQLYGAKDSTAVSRAVHCSLAFSVAAGIFLTVSGVFGAKHFLIWMKNPQDTMADSLTYMRIYFAGSIIVMLMNMGSSILRAAGDSRRPFIFMLISCGTNIFLDMFFVIKLNMAVAGVALATVIAQFINMLLVFTALIKTDDCYRVNIKKIRFEKDILKRMMRLGVPAGMESAMYGISNTLVQVAVNTLGTGIVAAWTLTGKIDGVFWACCQAAGMAVTNFAGQNFGAGRTDRIREASKKAFIMFTALTAVLSATLILLSPEILPLFTDDAELRITTYFIMKLFVPFYFLWVIIEIFSGILRGIGDAVVPVLITGVFICLFRIVWVYTVFPMHPGVMTLSLCYPASWLITDIPILIRYKRNPLLKNF